MRKLDRSKKYNLEHLTPKQLGQVFDEVAKTNLAWDNKTFFVENQYKRYDIGYEDSGWMLVGKDEGTTDARELFSGWFETDDPMNEEWLVYFDYTKNTTWGFNWEGEWFKRDYTDGNPDEGNYFAHLSKVYGALKEEAERRGYEGKFTFDLNELMCDGVTILKDGEWKTKEESDYYFLNSSHGENFYKKLEVVQVKNEFHDWREYVKYIQLGTNKVFHKPSEMFYNEFKKVSIEK